MIVPSFFLCHFLLKDKAAEKCVFFVFNWLLYLDVFFQKQCVLNHLGYINLANNGINYQPQLVIAGFLPSTVSFSKYKF